jgi:SPW repeat
MRRWRSEAILDVYNLVLGVFLFVSPWLFAYAGSVGRLDAWLTSSVLVLVSIAALVAFAEWEEWISLALGLWMIVSSWLLGFAHTRAMHIGIGVGCVVVYFAGLELWLIHYDRPMHAAPGEAHTGTAG